jgi:hypothetical protein
MTHHLSGGRTASGTTTRRSLAALGTAALTAVALMTAVPASAADDTLAPGSLTTNAGSIGGGQTVANLVVKDQSGTQDGWNKYVEFSGKYRGHRDYTLPSSVDPDDVTAIEVSTNYRGPAKSEQRWVWSLYDWSDASWTVVGDNVGAPSWGSWKLLSFASPSGASDYVNASGGIRVRLHANNNADAADIDFESVTVTSSSGTGGGTGGGTVVLPPANGKFSYQLGGDYAPESGVQVVSRDRTAPSAGSGYYNICYVNLLQTQPDEEGQSTSNPPYGTTQWWVLNHPELLLADANGDVIVDEDWNEALFDVRTAVKRTALLNIQSAWFEDCQSDGYQAIEPDNLDAFSRSTGLITFAQTKEYLKLVVPFVHDLGLAIAQKNTSDSPNGYGGIGSTFVDGSEGFDFASAEECAAYEECGGYTDEYGALVFEIEYTDNNPDQVRGSTTKTAYQWICQDDGASRSIILRDRDVVLPGNSAYHYEEC